MPRCCKEWVTLPQLLHGDPVALHSIPKLIFTGTFYLCNLMLILETFWNHRFDALRSKSFESPCCLSSYCFTERQAGRQAMAIHSTGAGLGLCCWLYSHKPPSVMPTVTPGKKENSQGRDQARSANVKKHSHCLCSGLNSSIVRFLEFLETKHE